ncbi:heterokaryon incompatibility domain-containing protein [Trichoderma velutinum]
MRLINVKTMEVEEFWEEEIPDYAILSHTWGERKAEVSFQDWKDLQTASQKQGYKKIVRACEQAAQDGNEYVWVDTNCIDKNSSTELSEAINSMFAWYRKSTRCNVFLEDFLWKDGTRDLATKLSICRWFTRGWTLQEFLAPKEAIFLDQNWVKFGTRTSLAKQICSFTPIGDEFLIDRPIELASIAERMSWLSTRKTKRVEDMAYCMLGIFDINMPLLDEHLCTIGADKAHNATVFTCLGTRHSHREITTVLGATQDADQTFWHPVKNVTNMASSNAAALG